MDTYIDLFPLGDVSDEPGESQQPDEGEELGEPEDPQSTACVQDLKRLTEILKLSKTNSTVLSTNH